MSRKLLPIFVARLAIAYLILVIPWPGVDTAFSAIYRGGTNALAGLLGVSCYVQAQTTPIHHPRGDVELKARNPQTGNGIKIEHGSRDWGYLPLAAGLALWLAVPPPWPGRLRAGFILMAALVVFVLLRIAVASVYGLGVVGVISMSSRRLELMGEFMLAFSGTPILSYVVPVIAWLVVLCRTYDFKKALALPASLQKTTGQTVVSNFGGATAPLDLFPSATWLMLSCVYSKELYCVVITVEEEEKLLDDIPTPNLPNALVPAPPERCWSSIERMISSAIIISSIWLFCAPPPMLLSIWLTLVEMDSMEMD